MDSAAPAFDIFDGWQTYPQNLPLSVLAIDARKYNTRLREDAGRLLLPSSEDSEVQVQGTVFQKGSYFDSLLNQINTEILYSIGTDSAHQSQHIDVETSDELAKCIQQSQTPQSAWVIEIGQLYSWGQLLISEEILRKLFTALRIHPDFLDVAHTFGNQVTATEESHIVFSAQLCGTPKTALSHSYDIAYNFKYVARHGRASLRDPFSIRQTGVYQKYHGQAARNIWLFIQAPDALSERFGAAAERIEVLNSATQLSYHALVLQCLSDDWREYVNFLEEDFSNLMDRGFLTDVVQTGGDGQLNVGSRDVRQLQVMTDKMKRLVHLLELNCTVCQRLQSFSQRIASSSNREVARPSQQGELMLANIMFQLETHAARLKSMVGRATGITSMVEHILDIRSAEAAHKLNCAMHDLSKKSAEENKLLRLLASQSTSDTRSMKVIALISSIFLPATFVATFFGSNFFGFEDSGKGYTLAVASNVWIYIVVALAFSFMAIGLWYWWSSGSPSKLDALDDIERQ